MNLAIDRTLHVSDLFGPFIDHKTIKLTSGWFCVTEFAMVCKSIVLPVRGGRNDQTALTLANRGNKIDNPG